METRGRREEPPDQCPPRDNTRLLPRYPRADNLQARAHARREERERESLGGKFVRAGKRKNLTNELKGMFDPFRREFRSRIF